MAHDRSDANLAQLGASILSFGHDERYREVVSQLRAGGLAAERIVVVHNPYDANDDWMPSPPDGVGVERMADNVGYGAAMNAGVARLADRVAGVLLLTHEVRLEPGALERLARALHDAPDYGVLGPAVDLRFDNGTTTSYGGLLTANAFTTHLTMAPQVDDRGIAEVPWVDGCAMVVRPSMLSETGPICSRYFMYFEEAELSDRARSSGWLVGVVPDARVSSEPGFAKRPGAYGYLFARNGLHWAHARGGTALAWRFALSQIVLAWRALPKPGGERFSDPPRRRDGNLLAAGRLAGLLAALAHRWGSPPRVLVRSTDIAPEPGSASAERRSGGRGPISPDRQS